MAVSQVRFFPQHRTMDEHGFDSMFGSRPFAIARFDGRQAMESGSTPTRSMMLLISVFSTTGLIQALVGIYGVIAFSVV